MSKFTLIPAQPGFSAKCAWAASWCDVIAWRMLADGEGALPVTLWGVFGSHGEDFEIKCPDGGLEVVQQ